MPANPLTPQQLAEAAALKSKMVTAAQMVGGSGYLMGWEVTKDGEEICSDPYIWKATREIECD